MKTSLQIPVLHQKMGVMDFSVDIAKQIERGLEQHENRIVEIVGALVNVHKGDIRDAREVREKFAGMTIKARREGGRIVLDCDNVPIDVLYDGQNVIWAAVEQISAALRDLIFAPSRPAPESSAEERSAWLRKFVEHAGFLYRGERGLVTFVWGGHRVPRPEYEFAKQASYWLTLAVPDVEIITGCGAGIMKAPFKGAQVAYGKQRAFSRFGQRDFVGFTETNILAAEPPNELVNRFVVFPTIESRMEAFIRASHRGRAHPGGAGTVEEVLFMLAMLSLGDNRKVPFTFDLVEREEGNYFRDLDQYLRTCVGDALDGFYEIHLGSPDEYAMTICEQTRRIPMRYLWNDDFVFHEDLQQPFAVSFEAMEKLDLTRDQDLFGLLVDLRRFFSAIVHLSVKDPDLLDSWGHDRPKIKGDKSILAATDAFVRRLEAEGRIHPNRKYATPYRIE